MREYDGWVGDFNYTYLETAAGTAPSQNGLGYTACQFTIEFQTQKIGGNSATWGPHLAIEQDAESGMPATDNVLVIGGYVSNGSYFGWDDRNNNSSIVQYTSSWSTGPWTHYAVVGTGGTTPQYRFYINGVLRATQTPVAGAYLTSLDTVYFTNGASNQYTGVIREICIWTGERYTSDFDSQYDSNLRWNGMMLV